MRYGCHYSWYIEPIRDKLVRQMELQDIGDKKEQSMDLSYMVVYVDVLKLTAHKTSLTCLYLLLGDI